MGKTLSAKDLEAVREAFVAEFGEHAAANSETGRLLGIERAEVADETAEESDAPDA
jgi:hypothetical protein